MVERAELIPDLPDLSALIDSRSPGSVTQVLGDYEASRAVYASHAESLRNAIVEKQAAEQALESLEPRRKELREATRSLAPQQRWDDPRQKELNSLESTRGMLDTKVSDLRETIPISEHEVERTFIRAEENFQRVCAAFEKNAVQFGKGPLDQAQLLISAGRASLDQYALERFPRPLAAHRLAMDALAQSQNPRSQAQPATQPPPPRTDMQSGVGLRRSGAVRRRRKPELEMDTPPPTPAPVQPQPQLQPQPRFQPQRLEVAENAVPAPPQPAAPVQPQPQSGVGVTLRNAVPRNWRRPQEPKFDMVTPLQPQRLEIAENAVAESSRGRQGPQLRNPRDSASLPRTQATKAQQRPGTPARSSAESSPTRKPGPKVGL